MLDPLIEFLEDYAKGLKSVDLVPIANRAMGEFKFRVFDEGKKVDLSPIGQYKDGSHKENRDARGKETSFVNLEYEGDMRRDIQLREQTEELIAIGFGQELQSDKFLGNEEGNGYRSGYGQIRGASEMELKAIKEAFELEIENKIRQNLRNVYR